MLKTIRNQTIALAGISQAACLVQQIANRGSCDSEAMEASIGSILKIDADDIEEIYGGLEGLTLGLRQLKKQLSSRDSMNPEQARYAAGILLLEKRLAERPHLLKEIRAGVEKASAQAEHFPVTHENILSGLADLYHRTVSTIHPRIMIAGSPEHLNNRLNTDRIRSLLLAAIRSAVLWRQAGGVRWKLLFARGKMLTEIDHLLKQA